MSTYQTNRCYAEVTFKAWEDATGSAYVTFGLSTIAEALPEGWRVIGVSGSELAQRVTLTIEGAAAEWNIAEAAGLECIGVFTTAGRSESALGLGQTADVCACLEQLFVGKPIE